MYTYQMTGKTVLWDANNSVYQIPAFQREYSWGTRDEGSPEVPEFWDDIVEDCWKKGRSHFIGTILCTCSNRDGGSCFEIVDGQQRITTLFLLCVALHNFLSDNNFNVTDWSKSLLDQNGQPRLILTERQNHNRSTLANLLLGNDQIIAQTESKDDRMLGAYRWLGKALFDEFSKQPAQAQEFAKVVFSRITLLFVILEQDDDAPTIFRTLNDRGRPVDDLDKFRGLITTADPNDRQLSEFSARVWANIEDDLDEREQQQFAVALGERNGFRTLRRRALDEIEDSINRAIEAKTFPSWLGTTQRCLDIFATMLNSPEKHGDARGLMRLEVEPLNPLILGIIERGGFDTETLRKLESVVVRILFWFDRPSAKLSQLNFKSCNVLQEQSPAWEEELTKL